jgi:hypothetical protein
MAASTPFGVFGIHVGMLAYCSMSVAHADESKRTKAGSNQLKVRHTNE